VSDIHFVLKGTVNLVYSAAVTQVAARAAARFSGCGALPGTALHSTEGAGAAATCPRASGGRFSGLAQALRLEQTTFEPPVVLATRCGSGQHPQYIGGCKGC